MIQQGGVLEGGKRRNKEKNYSIILRYLEIGGRGETRDQERGGGKINPVLNEFALKVLEEGVSIT